MSTLPDRYTRAPHETPRGKGNRAYARVLMCVVCGDMVTFRYKGGLCSKCDKEVSGEGEAGGPVGSDDPTTEAPRG